MSEDVLRSIALELKNQESNEYERTFISYYLPDMKVGEGAWATTHFNPDLEVRIFERTIEKEQKIDKEQEKSSMEIFGTWIDNTPIVGSKITIYRKDGRSYMEQKFNDGSTSTKEMVEKTLATGKRFEEKEGSSYGEYYLIDRQGNLQICDRKGLIATAKKIDR